MARQRVLIRRRARPTVERALQRIKHPGPRSRLTGFKDAANARRPFPETGKLASGERHCCPTALQPLRPRRAAERGRVPAIDGERAMRSGRPKAGPTNAPEQHPLLRQQRDAAPRCRVVDRTDPNDRRGPGGPLKPVASSRQLQTIEFRGECSSLAAGPRLPLVVTERSRGQQPLQLRSRTPSCIHHPLPHRRDSRRSRHGAKAHVREDAGRRARRASR